MDTINAMVVAGALGAWADAAERDEQETNNDNSKVLWLEGSE